MKFSKRSAARSDDWVWQLSAPTNPYYGSAAANRSSCSICHTIAFPALAAFRSIRLILISSSYLFAKIMFAKNIYRKKIPKKKNKTGKKSKPKNTSKNKPRNKPKDINEAETEEGIVRSRHQGKYRHNFSATKPDRHHYERRSDGWPDQALWSKQNSLSNSLVWPFSSPIRDVLSPIRLFTWSNYFNENHHWSGFFYRWMAVREMVGRLVTSHNLQAVTVFRFK